MTDYEITEFFISHTEQKELFIDLFPDADFIRDMSIDDFRECCIAYIEAYKKL